MGNTQKQRIVVVGNGMVGHRFVEELCDRLDSASVEIITSVLACASSRCSGTRWPVEA